MMLRAWMLGVAMLVANTAGAQAPAPPPAKANAPVPMKAMGAAPMAAPAAAPVAPTAPAAGAAAKVKGEPVKARDCNAVTLGYRSRCLELTRVQQLCQGLQGPAKQTCIQKNIHYARMKSDCSGAKTEAAKAQCLKNNQVMDAAEACYGKTGDALKVCAHAVEAKQAGKGAKPAKAGS